MKHCAYCGAPIPAGRIVCGARCRAQLGGASTAMRHRLGTRTASDGARLVYVGREHHLADCRGYAREARLVAEGMLGRRLEPHEQVVHLNGDPNDCTLGNLAVRVTRRTRDGRLPWGVAAGE